MVGGGNPHTTFDGMAREWVARVFFGWGSSLKLRVKIESDVERVKMHIL